MNHPFNCPKCGEEFLYESFDYNLEGCYYKCGSRFNYIYIAGIKDHETFFQKNSCRITELERLLKQAIENANLIAQSLKDVGCYIRYCEGGGPEDVQGSLALSVTKLKNKVMRLQNEISNSK